MNVVTAWIRGDSRMNEDCCEKDKVMWFKKTYFYKNINDWKMYIKQKTNSKRKNMSLNTEQS